MNRFVLEGETSAPIWKRLVSNVVRMVDEGTLTDGARLPPSRTLAKDLGINRSTVCRAYEELASLGYLESRQGSYSTVRARARLVPQSRAVRPLIDWTQAAAPQVEQVHRDVASLPLALQPGKGWIDFGSFAADPSLSPTEDFRRIVKQVLAERGSTLLDYGDPAGFPALRETLATRMKAHGIQASSQDVLITQGAQHALELVLRLLARPGAAVVVEAPTYGLIVPLLRLHGLRPLEVPMRADGMDLDALEKTLKAERPALVYTMPSFQNPTGITTSQAHRERLLALCERHAVPILEDGFEEDMKYFGRGVLPIKSMDARGLVIYVGTFSKVLFPGLRVGWITAERECLHRLALLTRVTSLAGNYLPQAALERFCHEGRYDRYLRRVHSVFRKRMAAMLKGLETRCGNSGLEWTRPQGGSTLWVRVTSGRLQDEGRLAERCAKERVAITAGSVFFATPPSELAFRLSIAKVRTHEVDEGCRRLARALSFPA